MEQRDGTLEYMHDNSSAFTWQYRDNPEIFKYMFGGIQWQHFPTNTIINKNGLRIVGMFIIIAMDYLFKWN
jgi:hypothetical protein